MRECARLDCGNTFTPRTIKHVFCSYECRRWIVHGIPANPIESYTPRETRFVAVDGEGVGRGKEHRYVLLGVGSHQAEWPDGVQDITEIFSFLYGQYTRNPHAAFVGFFLSYDFNMWLKALPRERASMLISPQGIGKRARRSPNGQALGPFPVRWKGWEFDLLGNKRFKLRPDETSGWMYICDGGPFYQCSLLTAVNPARWQTPIITDSEYAILQEGKARRDSAVLDDDMRYYNRLENDVFARLMNTQRDGLEQANVRLKKQQWFGPGQAAQAWMRLGNKLQRTTERIARLPGGLLDAAIASYYGGWFEIPCHGHVPGITHEYDVNSAYPFIASKLPCLCGQWRSGRNKPPKDDLCMVRCIARGSSPYLGGLPYRREDGAILRPQYTEGWYWQHEVEAAKRAGLIDDVTVLEWWAYKGCEHPPPLDVLNTLYESRLRIGKDSPAGKSFKLIYNSVYGKFAQSEGSPVFANPFYASLITAGCRVMILDAIASHPQGAEAVAMVATDGVYFLERHPELDAHISERMGDWSLAERLDLTLFKPGVYWDNATREAIADGQTPRFKSRGINAEDFSKSIADVDRQFRDWDTGVITWPSVKFRSRFVQVSIRQALDWTDAMSEPKRSAVYRNQAGRIIENRELEQDSDPKTKRCPGVMAYDGRVWRSAPWGGGPHWPASAPYDKRFGLVTDGGFGSYVNDDGPVMLSFRQALGVG